MGPRGGGGGGGGRRGRSPSYEDYYSYYSYSRSPTPRPRRHRGGGGRGGDRRRSRSRRRDRGGCDRHERGGHDRGHERGGRDRGRSDYDGGSGRGRGGGGDRGCDRDRRDSGGRGNMTKDTPRSPSRDGDPSNSYIHDMLIDREKARIDRDWGEADRIRDELRRAGVEIYDRERRWEARDGRTGARPNHDDRKRGD